MRQRVLTVMGLAVGVLVIYTLLFSSPAGARDGDAWRWGGSLATRAAGETEEAGAAPAVRSPGPAVGSERQRDDGPEPVLWGSDPFVRDWVLTDELAELNLKAITMGGEKAYVLINDQILEQGDVIGGKRIVVIESDKVILEQGGRTFALVLGE